MTGKLQLTDAPDQLKAISRRAEGDAADQARKRLRISPSSHSAIASSSRDIQTATTSRNRISTLPIELIIRIFVLCDGDSITLARLECVCRQWRHILKHTPKPWERVHLWEPQKDFLNTAIAMHEIPAEPMSSYPGKVVLKALGRAAQRTKNRIVSVRIDVRRRCSAEEAEKMQHFLRESEYSLKALSIHASFHSFRGWMGCHRYSRLESFHLYGGYQTAGPVPRDELFIVVPVNPTVRDFIVLGPATLLSTETFAALRTWVQYDTKHTASIRPEYLYDTIKASQSTLEHMRYQWIGQPLGEALTESTVLTLPRLCSFEATARQPLGPSPIIHRLHAPNLRMLSVVSARHDQLLDLYAGFCDLSRLEELSISFSESPITAASRASALQFFAKLQKLRKLDISADGQTAVLDLVIACMAPTEWQRESVRISGAAGSSFLPAVKTLIIRRHPHMTGSHLMRVVAARLKRDAGPDRIAPSAGSANGVNKLSAAFKTNSSSAFKRAKSSAFSTASSSKGGHRTSSPAQPQASSPVRMPDVEALSTVILHRCPMLDPQAAAWLESKVATFAHIDQDRAARQRAEASSRSIRPW
ncbi:hypothetical protein OC861_006186 [Tilletia horrida]|nr:hypothetical protein OC861_006186 [Tilletia horrida]